MRNDVMLMLTILRWPLVVSGPGCWASPYRCVSIQIALVVGGAHDCMPLSLQCIAGDAWHAAQPCSPEAPLLSGASRLSCHDIPHCACSDVSHVTLRSQNLTQEDFGKNDRFSKI